MDHAVYRRPQSINPRKTDRVTEPQSNGIWFSAKCIFRHLRTDGDVEKTFYEERFALIQAENFDAAVIAAEQDAEAYSADIENCRFLGFTDIFQLGSKAIGHRTEFYSLLRESDLGENEYLDRFYDTGMERSREFQSDEGSDDPA